MCAKKAKKLSTLASASSVAPPATSPATTADSPADVEHAVSWYDSTDPRKRRVARIALVLIWIYVGALWLLALDQTFNWGIFGPKLSALD